MCMHDCGWEDAMNRVIIEEKMDLGTINPVNEQSILQRL